MFGVIAIVFFDRRVLETSGRSGRRERAIAPAGYSRLNAIRTIKPGLASSSATPSEAS